MQTDKIKAMVTSMKLNTEIYKNFRAVCICEGVSSARQVESLMLKYTKSKAAQAAKHFTKVAKRIEN